MTEISPAALLASVCLLAVPMVISFAKGLRLEKEIVWSTLRGFVQLLLMGWLLTNLFSWESVYALSGLLVLMSFVATHTAGKRGRWHPFADWIAFAGIAAAELVALAVWIGFGLVPFEARYVFPTSGMVMGSAMITAGLTFERMYNEFLHTKPQILAKLALGASPYQASEDLIGHTISAALIPSVDTLKTIGLVQLPGMMTGLIFAGVSPVIAVKFQLVILITLMAANTLTALIVTFLAYRAFFTRSLF